MSDFTTSSAPADVVRRQYLASAAGDLEALRATLAPDVEWTEMAGFPLAGTYRTPEGVTTNVMEKLGQEWDDQQGDRQTDQRPGRPPLRRSRRAHRAVRAVRRLRARSRRDGLKNHTTTAISSTSAPAIVNHHHDPEP